MSNIEFFHLSASLLEPTAVPFGNSQHSSTMPHASTRTVGTDNLQTSNLLHTNTGLENADSTEDNPVNSPVNTSESSGAVDADFEEAVFNTGKRHSTNEDTSSPKKQKTLDPETKAEDTSLFQGQQKGIGGNSQQKRTRPSSVIKKKVNYVVIALRF